MDSSTNTLTVPTMINVYDHRYLVNIKVKYGFSTTVEFLSSHKSRKDFLNAIHQCVQETLEDAELRKELIAAGKTDFYWEDFFRYVSDTTCAKYGVKLCDNTAITVTCSMTDSLCALS